MTSKTVVDGNTSYIGGMDTSRSPSIISQNQYVWSVNMEISRGKEGIRTRRGFKCLKIIFDTDKEREIFETGNVQGSGSYYSYKSDAIIFFVSVNGYIIEFRPVYTNTYKAIFSQFRNNPNIKKCYINEVPGGVIINDGESSPIYIFDTSRGRARPSNNQIPPSHGGIYCQNRFWFISQDRRFVFASSIQDPISMEEAILANVYGFASPDETEDIIAVGRQKTISRDVTGGNLAFATNKSNYSVDVRGDRSRWGFQNGIGSVDNVVNDVGAVSPFSYESANANIYFRNLEYGLMSTRSAQYQFVNNDSFSPISIESSLFFDIDSKEFLDCCYTKYYNSRIYTTIGPRLKDGFVYWSGMIVLSPDIYFSTKDRSEINRVESIFTGIRPWTITVNKDYNDIDNIFIVSHDEDCVNRIYTIDEEIDFDIDEKGKKKEIESKLLTRLMSFPSRSEMTSMVPKFPTNQFYNYTSNRNLGVKVYTRDSDNGSFNKIWEVTHNVINPTSRNSLFPFNASNPSNVQVTFSDDSSVSFFERQDLFVFNGQVNLLKNIRVASTEALNQTVTTELDFVRNKNISCEFPNRIYSYSIHGGECKYPRDDSPEYLKFIDPSFKLETLREAMKYWWLRQGPKGEKGDTGKRGPRGFPGVSGGAVNISSLTGGGPDSLDGQETPGLVIPYVGTFLLGMELQDWLLKTRAAEVEDGADYIIPDDNSSLVWVRIR